MKSERNDLKQQTQQLQSVNAKTKDEYKSHLSDMDAAVKAAQEEHTKVLAATKKDRKEKVRAWCTKKTSCTLPHFLTIHTMKNYLYHMLIVCLIPALVMVNWRENPKKSEGEKQKQILGRVTNFVHGQL